MQSSVFTRYPHPSGSPSPCLAAPQYLDIGPQFSIGVATPQPGSRTWMPSGGASMNWQGEFTSMAVSYTHMVASGGGLIGAVQMDAANASLRRQLARLLSASLTGAL